MYDVMLVMDWALLGVVLVELVGGLVVLLW
jgi:hypothetical protein